MNLFHLLIIPVLLYLIWISWGSLPRLIFALDPSRLRYQFVDALDEEPATTTVNRFSEIVGQLQQLGFQRLGLKTEKLPLWSSTIYEISLASPDRHAFAALIKDPKRCVYYILHALHQRGHPAYRWQWRSLSSDPTGGLCPASLRLRQPGTGPGGTSGTAAAFHRHRVSALLLVHTGVASGSHAPILCSTGHPTTGTPTRNLRTGRPALSHFTHRHPGISWLTGLRELHNRSRSFSRGPLPLQRTPASVCNTIIGRR